MRNGIIILLLLMMTGCTFFKKKDKSNIKITTKYTAWKGKKNGIYFHSCNQNEIAEFRKMNEYDCYFLIGNLLFTIREKFILNEKGNLIEYWNYLPEGQLTYNLTELKNDPKFLKSIGGSEPNIKILENENQVINMKDTLEIETIFTEQKLILIKGNKSKSRILFEYQ